VSAVLRKWERSVSPNYHVPLSALLGGDGARREFTENFLGRLDQPVRATVALRGRFNNWPRLPYQLGELFLHGADKCQKSLGGLVRRLAAPTGLDDSANGKSLRLEA